MKTKFPTLLARVSAGVALLLAPSSFAAVLLLTHTGTGSGQIGATSFTNATFTISDTVDTANRQVIPSGGGFFIDDSSASIAITGVGTYPFSSPTRTFVNNSVTSWDFPGQGLEAAIYSMGRVTRRFPLGICSPGLARLPAPEP